MTDIVSVSKAELREMMDEAVERGVHNALVKMGIDADDPLAVQKDMAYIRDLRASTDKVKAAALKAAIAVLVPGFLAVLWLGFKGYIGR